MVALSRRSVLRSALAGVAGRTVLRTAVLGAAGTGMTLTASGCAASSDPGQVAADPDLSLLADTERSLIAAYDLALVHLTGAARTQAAARRRRHGYHLEQATGSASPDAATTPTPLVPLPTTTPAGQTTPSVPGASPSGSMSSPTASPSSPAAAGDQAAWLRWLAANEQQAALAQRRVAGRSTDLAVVRLAALTHGHERTHGIADLAALAQGDWTTLATASGLADTLEALAVALDQHHRLLWATGRLGPGLVGADRSRARETAEEHARTRDRVRRVLAAAGVTPPAPAPSYALAVAASDAAAARRILRDAERGVAVAWLDVAVSARRGSGDPTTARAAVALLGEAAIRAHGWGNREAFPGFGDASLRLA